MATKLDHARLLKLEGISKYRRIIPSWLRGQEVVGKVGCTHNSQFDLVQLVDFGEEVAQVATGLFLMEVCIIQTHLRRCFVRE